MLLDRAGRQVQARARAPGWSGPRRPTSARRPPGWSRPAPAVSPAPPSRRGRGGEPARRPGAAGRGRPPPPAARRGRRRRRRPPAARPPARPSRRPAPPRRPPGARTAGTRRPAGPSRRRRRRRRRRPRRRARPGRAAPPRRSRAELATIRCRVAPDPRTLLGLRPGRGVLAVDREQQHPQAEERRGDGGRRPLQEPGAGRHLGQRPRAVLGQQRRGRPAVTPGAAVHVQVVRAPAPAPRPGTPPSPRSGRAGRARPPAWTSAIGRVARRSRRDASTLSRAAARPSSDRNCLISPAAICRSRVATRARAPTSTASSRACRSRSTLSVRS